MSFHNTIFSHITLVSFHNTFFKCHFLWSVFGLQLLCKSKIPWPTRGFGTRFSKTFIKSENTTHETIIHSPAGRVLWFHSLYFLIQFMYLRPWSQIPLVDHGISYITIYCSLDHELTDLHQERLKFSI